MNFDHNLISFFKKHNLYNEEMFNYFQKNSTMIDYEDDEQRCFIGCFYIYGEKNILKSIHLNIPFVYNEITMLISIHEIVHAIELYPYLNKKVKIKDTREILPMLYEKIYVDERQDETLYKYQKYLDSTIDKKDTSYYIALSVREELLKNYNYDINKMKKLSKKLARKYK